ncbi:MAG: 2Fe-2S iron-sulfur cluster-binding protein [Chloroflexi bacterium]|nr:2Fe-2S iron-sulfur cluster-binding protein [Chloroflexota bacterium]
MSEQNVKVSVVRSDGSALQCQVEYEENLTVSRILEKIYLSRDRSLGYRHFCCKIGRCLSCLVQVNGKVVQACKETVAPGADIRLGAADAEKLIRDLAIDFEREAPRLQPVRSVELT